MGRFIVTLVALAQMGWTVYVTYAYFEFRRRAAGLDKPQLWLPRRERLAHARKMLQREEDDYNQFLLDRTTNYLKERDLP